MRLIDEPLSAKLRRLTAVRKELGWSEETCAHHLGVTVSTLHRWGQGTSLPKSRVVIGAIEQFLARYSPERMRQPDEEALR